MANEKIPFLGNMQCSVKEWKGVVQPTYFENFGGDMYIYTHTHTYVEWEKKKIEEKQV
jgi:hypothetical protein